MTATQFIGVFIRLFSIFLIFQILPLIGYGLSIAEKDGSQMGLIIYFVGIPLLILAAVLLWKFPLTIANKLVPKTNDQDQIAFPFDQFVRFSIIVFALWILIVKVLAQIAYLVPLLIFISRNHQYMSDYEQFEFMRIAPLVFEFLAAAILLYKSKALSKLLVNLEK